MAEFSEYMDEIDVQMLSIISESSEPISSNQIMEGVNERYGTSYTSKRIRNRLDTLTYHHYVDCVSERLRGSVQRKLYTIHEEVIA